MILNFLKPRLEKGNNANYWLKKIERNITRDQEINQQLNFLGWTVVRFWGKEILNNTDECIKVIEETIFESTCNSLEEDWDGN